MWLLIAFIAVPMIEIALFIQVGGAIGLGWTLAIVLITAVLGAWLVRTQGTMALGQLRSSFADMRDPTEHLVHGAMILFAGALLLTPGFFTDAVGFSFLVPAIRSAVYRAIQARVQVHSFDAQRGGPTTYHQHRRPGAEQDVIEGEYHEINEAPPGEGGSSGWTKH